MAGVLSLSLLAGCDHNSAENDTVRLDPNNPVSLTVWHYYNGAQQAAFDELVEEFNATTGKETGIYVEGYSQGSVADLEKAVSDSVAEKVGAQEMPDLFSTYADTAYAIQQQGKLADLSAYFTEDELSEYVDERRDPWISTDSALKKLKENYSLFNDWLLALAAYNCGSGAIMRALENSEEKNFSSLCRQELIPMHARQYVPNFLKIADLIENALFYEETKIYEASCIFDTTCNAADSSTNLSEKEPDPTFFYYDFDYVTVAANISLKSLAKELRLDYQILKNLNLSLVKEQTPPDRKYRLRLPAGMALSCKDALFAINNRQKNTENKKENLNSN